jgi:hypothetical protein
MAWVDTNYERFGVIKIEGEKVKVYKDQFNYITIPVNKQVTSAKWVDDGLMIISADGKVRLYEDYNIYTYISI